MTKTEAVKDYLKRQREQVPSYLQGVLDLFEGNLRVLIKQNYVSTTLVLSDCFLQEDDSKFEGLLDLFRFRSKRLPTDDYNTIMGAFYANQNLLYNGECIYEKEFSDLTEQQVKQSCRLAQSWAKGVQQAWKRAAVAGLSVVARKQPRKTVKWADEGSLNLETTTCR